MQIHPYLFAGIGSKPWVTYSIRDGIAETKVWKFWFFDTREFVHLHGAKVSNTRTRFNRGDCVIVNNQAELKWTNVPDVRGVYDALERAARGLSPDLHDTSRKADSSELAQPHQAAAPEPLQAIVAPRPVSQPKVFVKPNLGVNTFHEYLDQGETTIDAASRFFDAGQPEEVFGTFPPIAMDPIRRLVDTVAQDGRNAAEERRVEFRNKMIVFKSWLVWGTCHYYGKGEEQDTVMFTGIPLSYITKFEWNQSQLSIRGFHTESDKSKYESHQGSEEFFNISAGQSVEDPIRFSPDEAQRLKNVIEQLKAGGRLSAT